MKSKKGQPLSREFQTGVRSSTHCKEGKLVDHYFDDVRTVYEGFKRGMRFENGSRQCLGMRENRGQGSFAYLSYKEVHAKSHAFGSALVDQLKLESGQDTFVGIYARNSVEWAVTDLGCQMFRMPTVPLYDTLGKEAQIFIVNQARIQTVLCDDLKRTESLLQDAAKMSTLKHVIVTLSEVPGDLLQLAAQVGITVYRFADLVAHGEKNLRDIKPPTPEDIFTVCYTSGTTGMPKGVIVTHGNIVASAAGVLRVEREYPFVKYGPRNVLISYLPLAHIFERLLESAVLSLGGTIGYFSGDLKRMLEDLQDIRPTIFPCVPRVGNRLVDKIQSEVQAASKLKQKIFKKAYNAKLGFVRRGKVTSKTFWDMLVFKKIQKLLGGRVKVIVCGSAPVHPNVLEFLRVATGSVVIEGYGQTETSSATAISYCWDMTCSQVGPPLPSNYVKLDDVPELNYFSKDNKGEICVKGPNCTRGYLRDPEKTAELIDKDGWLHTGDIGEWLPNGTLKIIDRKKHIFKLAQGEYVAPEKIETVYGRCPLVAQVFVDGDSLQTCTVSIVVPNEEKVRELLAANCANYASLQGRQIDSATISFEELCKIPEIKTAILTAMTQLGKAENLNGIEQIKDCYLSSDLFTIENDLLTQSMKTKRPQVRKHYKAQIDRMYEAIKAKAAEASVAANGQF